MSSIGGTRRPGAACARASPTIACSCRTSPRTTSKPPATLPCSTSMRRSSKGRRCRRCARTSTSEAEVSSEVASVYEHCARALDASLGAGAHGLPLMHGGDWNDGMNRVGIHGRGESVWLGWFLYATLRAFAPIAAARGDATRARTLAADRRIAAARARPQRVGRRMVPARLFRRRLTARLGVQPRMPDRFDRAKLGDHLRRGRSGARAAGDGRRVGVPRQARRRHGAAVHAAVQCERSPTPATSRATCRACARTARQYTHAAAWCVIAYAMQGDGDRAFELFGMLNPINHASTRGGAHRYKIEPYVVPGDVYSEPPHVGRGGWSWYTGAAGWLYRAGIEYMLGVRVQGDHVRVAPCIPHEWSGYTVRYRRGGATYVIRVENPLRISSGAVDIDVDGTRVAGDRFAAPDDGARAPRRRADPRRCAGRHDCRGRRRRRQGCCGSALTITVTQRPVAHPAPTMRRPCEVAARPKGSAGTAGRRAHRDTARAGAA